MLVLPILTVSHGIKKEIPLIQILKYSEFSISNLKTYLKIIEVQHSNIVIKQAILETGHFTSRIFKQKNNLFGMYQNGRFMKFSHWTECVDRYKSIIQRKMSKHYNGCYYTFLTNMNYAEDADYINKLKGIKLSKYNT